MIDASPSHSATSSSHASRFSDIFERSAEVYADAPGRVNLMGEHTDYNGGYVLPVAIAQHTGVELSRRLDNTVRVFSANFTTEKPERFRESYTLGHETHTGSWVDYIQGITWALRTEGYPLSGFDLFVDSNIPLGSGLSSSAALEVSLLRALRQLFGLALTDIQIAQIGQRAEVEFVGAPVGIMDQMACSLADEHHALFLDTRALQFERVALPLHTELVVINSGIAHNHATGDYRTRRTECERAASLLGVLQLRDLTIQDSTRVFSSLPEPLGRRARHVITENERVLDTVRAMRSQDLPRLGELFYESHASMRDDYEVSVPEIDLLIDLARSCADIYGARLTGGGFGGSVVMLAHQGRGRQAADSITHSYENRSGQTATVLVPGEPL